MVFRCSIVVLGALLAIFATLSTSAIEPRSAEAANTVKTCGGGTIKLNAKEERTLLLHNRKRRSRGLRPLCVHPKLTKAARAHSADMIRKDYFGHGSVERRLKHYGYHWRVYAENIAGGYGRYASPDNTFRRWMKSGSHRSNILDRRFREIGIGTATGRFKGHKGYSMYTVDFGTRR
jgi:uncharacterized protein YkwD